jgi:2-polyprenyl-3-methyl-5-hydroxy-6-metoxy-1,4-benzoquinol methylase
VLDHGCGSKLRTAIWKGAELYGIDPLLNEFKAQIEWSDLKTLKEGYSVSGETYVEKLKERMDIVISVNAIDHGPDWRKSIDNMHAYLKEKGHMFLFVDIEKKHSPNDKIHRTIRVFELLEYIDKKFNILHKGTSDGFSRACSKISLRAEKK